MCVFAYSCELLMCIALHCSSVHVCVCARVCMCVCVVVLAAYFLMYRCAHVIHCSAVHSTDPLWSDCFGDKVVLVHCPGPLADGRAGSGHLGERQWGGVGGKWGGVGGGAVGMCGGGAVGKCGGGAVGRCGRVAVGRCG